MKNKNDTYIIYHVFSHGMDEWVETLKEAKKLYNLFKSEYGCARLYEEERTRDEDYDPIEENCLMSVGEFPR